MVVTLFAGSRLPTDQRIVEDTKRLAVACARRGHTLVFGGSERGLMGVAARAMLDAGGRVIGIHCDQLTEVEPSMAGLSQLDVLPSLADRRARLISIADLIVVMPGGVGTLDEFFEAVSLRSLGALRARIVLVNACGFFNPLIAQIRQQISIGFLPAGADWFVVVDRPDQVFTD